MVEVVARREVPARTRKLRSTDAGAAHPVDRRPVPTPRGKETLLSGPLPRSGDRRRDGGSGPVGCTDRNRVGHVRGGAMASAERPIPAERPLVGRPAAHHWGLGSSSAVPQSARLGCVARSDQVRRSPVRLAARRRADPECTAPSVARASAPCRKAVRRGRWLGRVRSTVGRPARGSGRARRPPPGPIQPRPGSLRSLSRG